MDNKRVLDTKYAGINFLYFASLCIMMSYGTVYLKTVGLKEGAIGIILSCANIVTTFLQPTIATYVDKKHLPVYKVSALIGIVSAVVAGLLFLTTKLPLLVGFLFGLLMCLLVTMTPLLNALTFAFEKNGIDLNYGLARGIGSASYAIVSLVLGYVVKWISPIYLPLINLVIILGFIPLVRSFHLREGSTVEDIEVEEVIEENDESIIDFAKRYVVFLLFLLGVIFVYADHQVINTYMINIVENIGGTSSGMGTATFIAAILELPAMTIFQKYKDRLNIPHVIIFSGIMFTVKHILTVFAPNMFIFYIAQMLQMFAYALFIPASVYYVDQLFDKKDAVKGQTLVTMSFTIAGIFGTAVGGFMFELTNVMVTLRVFAILSVIGSIMMFFFTKDRVNG